MIATCVAHRWTLDDYRDPAHPLQVSLASVIERMSGERIAATGVDFVSMGAITHSAKAVDVSFELA